MNEISAKRFSVYNFLKVCVDEKHENKLTT